MGMGMGMDSAAQLSDETRPPERRAEESRGAQPKSEERGREPWKLRKGLRRGVLFQGFTITSPPHHPPLYCTPILRSVYYKSLAQLKL